MEIFSDFSTIDEPIELPPGFRFHPSDEELITHYLSPKLLDTTFETKAIGEVDLNKVEPWDLPWMAKMGEKEWYFFCVIDRKYPTGSRTNRATKAGYWKATGKDKEIYRAKILIGIKKTLVFYGGRAPRGEKTNWVMHEYRMEGKHSMHNPPKTSRNECVICRVFKKSSGGKKVHISGLVRGQNCNSRSSDLPPLMELSSDENPNNNTAVEGSNVTYSNQMEDHRDKYFEESSSRSTKNDFSPFPFNFPKDSTPKSSLSSQIIPSTDNLYYRDSVLLQDQSVFKFLLENNGKQITKPEFSGDVIMKANMSMSSSAMFNQEMGFKSSEDQEFQFISTGPVDLDCLWNY